MSTAGMKERFGVNRLCTWIAMMGIAGLAAPLGVQAQSYMDPNRVLVVYKANSVDTDKDGKGDSEQVALYYAAKRGVPAQNLLGLTITIPYHYYYTAQYSKFYSEMVQPIKNKLAALGALNIDVILLAGELPTVFYDAANKTSSIDNALMGLNLLTSSAATVIERRENPYFEYSPGIEHTPGIREDIGHFDHASYQIQGTDMYLVTRLGSNSNMRALEQIDQSLYAEKYLYPAPGYYYGTVYVDSVYGLNGQRYTDAVLSVQNVVLFGSYYPAQDVDMNVAYAEHYFLGTGFPLKWENSMAGAVIGDASATWSDLTPALAAPRALFYSGWRNFNKYNNVWEWLPGSAGSDVSSSSIFNVQALKNGLTAGTYVLGESGLVGNPRPNVLLYYLLNGYNFAEASNVATPYVAWYTVNEGDPLYTPMAPKTPVVDTQAPALVAGYPKLTVNTSTGAAVLSMLIDDTAGPEVVSARVEYGPDTNYGTSVTSAGGFTRRPQVNLPWVLGGEYFYRVVLTDPVGNITTTPGFYYKSPVAPPSIATPASASPNPVTGKTTTLSVLGADRKYSELQLTYTWAASGSAAVTFSDNGTNTAKNTTAAFTRAGTYGCTVTIRNPEAGIATSSVNVVVSQIPTTLTVTPALAYVTIGFTRQFSASVADQFGNPITNPTVAWSVSGGGTISGTGLFTATTIGGPFTVTATASGLISTATVNVLLVGEVPPGPPPTFVLKGEPSELSGTTNGSAVSPSTGPSGILRIAGTGSVNFAPATTDNGIYFLNCCANTNNAYMLFSGATVGQVFDPAQGEIRFNLKSRQAWAQRKLGSYRQVFDVQDTPGRYLFSFIVSNASGYMAFAFRLGSTAADYYYVPLGQEDTLFGQGVTVRIRLVWDGLKRYLYINDVLRVTTPYTKVLPSWSSTSTFAVGALNYAPYGGYNSCDDIIDEFTVYPSPLP